MEKTFDINPKFCLRREAAVAGRPQQVWRYRLKVRT